MSTPTEGLERALEAANRRAAQLEHVLDRAIKLEAENARLREQVAELREDRERLDFISQGNINAEEATEIVNGHRYKGKYRGSIRAAIDAARKGETR